MKSQKKIQIADTLHGSIKLNSIEKQVISTQIFNRLHNICQNSTVYLTFPTNRTKRFEHSVGTMWLCGKIFRQSIANAEENTVSELFSDLQKIIDSEIRSSLKKYADKYRQKIGDSNLNYKKLVKYKEIRIFGEYNDVISTNIKEEYRSTYMIVYQAIRLCGLLHDVGHPPFSHITEFALKNIWNKVKHIEEKNSRQNLFEECMKPYFQTNQDLHEQIGNKITDKVLDEIIPVISTQDCSDNEIFEQQLFSILVAQITSAILEEKKPIFSQLHRIIDGTLDGDRLDYVCRDPINSGINVGSIEYDRIIENMMLVKYEGCYIFASSSKAVDAIEDFFNRRWKMYKQIIYHHRVMKTDYLLQNSIETLAWKYLEKNDNEEEPTNVLPYNVSGLWKAIRDHDSYTYFFNTLIQWDDCWLLTILKAHYFDEYVDSSLSEDQNIKNELEELLANRKKYFSLVKRMEDFITIDVAIESVMKQQYNEILISRFQQLEFNEGEGKISNDLHMSQTISFEIDPTLKLMKELFEKINARERVEEKIPRNGFVLPKVKKVFNNIFEENWFERIVEETRDEIIESNFNIKDIIIVSKKVKTGISGSKDCNEPGGLGVYTFDKSGNIKVCNFLDISNLNNILLDDVDYMPVFYMYILSTGDIDYQGIRKQLGIGIGIKIMEKIINKINSFLQNK